MKRKIIISTFLLLAAFVSIESQSLYGSGISPKSALVRVIFKETSGDLNLEVGNITFSSAGKSESLKYHQVAPGMYFFELGTEWIEFIPQSGKYFTLIINGEQCQVFEDTEHSSPAKTQVYFYNLAENDAATFHITNKTDAVFQNTSSLTSEQVAINPLDINFTITMESGKSIDLGSLPMTRGGSTSVILFENGGILQTQIFEAEIATGL